MNAFSRAWRTQPEGVPVERVRRQKDIFTITTSGAHLKTGGSDCAGFRYGPTRKSRGSGCSREAPSAAPRRRCAFFRALWMLSVNMYDIMGLANLTPVGPVHTLKPYISFKMTEV